MSLYIFLSLYMYLLLCPLAFQPPTFMWFFIVLLCWLLELVHLSLSLSLFLKGGKAVNHCEVFVFCCSCWRSGRGWWTCVKTWSVSATSWQPWARSLTRTKQRWDRMRCLWSRHCDWSLHLAWLGDVHTDQGWMDKYFQRMESLARMKELPARIRFMLLDLSELRLNKVCAGRFFSFTIMVLKLKWWWFLCAYIYQDVCVGARGKQFTFFFYNCTKPHWYCTLNT